MTRPPESLFWAAVREDLRRRPLGPARLRGAIQVALRRMRRGR